MVELKRLKISVLEKQSLIADKLEELTYYEAAKLLVGLTALFNDINRAYINKDQEGFCLSLVREGLIPLSFKKGQRSRRWIARQRSKVQYPS